MQLKVLNGTLKGQVLSMYNIEMVTDYSTPVSVRSPRLYTTGETPLLQFPRGSIMPHGVEAGDFFEVAWLNES